MAVLAATTIPAHSGSNQCALRADIVKGLKGRFFEDPISMGLVKGGAILEIFASTDGVTWTALRTTPDGRACIIGHGESWIDVRKPAGNKV